MAPGEGLVHGYLATATSSKRWAAATGSPSLTKVHRSIQSANVGQIGTGSRFSVTARPEVYGRIGGRTYSLDSDALL